MYWLTKPAKWKQKFCANAKVISVPINWNDWNEKREYLQMWSVCCGKFPVYQWVSFAFLLNELHILKKCKTPHIIKDITQGGVKRMLMIYGPSGEMGKNNKVDSISRFFSGWLNQIHMHATKKLHNHETAITWRTGFFL